MGTWDHGLLDNDSVLDGLGELSNGVFADITTLGAAVPTEATARRLAAAVGALLQLSAYSFRDDANGPAIVAALQAHAPGLAGLPATVRHVLGQVEKGEGEALARRPASMDLGLVELLHVGATKAPFGAREPALFASVEGAAYVQELAMRCVAAVEADLEDESNWSDLCREAAGLGPLAALLVQEPCHIPASTLERWRRCAQEGLAVLESEPDDELPFHRLYDANLDKVFAALLERFR